MQTPTMLREALPYFRMFSGKTVVLKFSGKNLEKDIFENLLADLLVMKAIGIHIIIIHGAGPQINERLPKASQKINGVRVTTKEEMAIIAEVIPELSEYIAGELQNAGLSTCFLPNIFAVQKKEFPEYTGEHWTGEILGVDAQKIEEALRRGDIPIFSPVVENERGEHFNINADELSVAIAGAIKAKKMVFFTDVDGIYDKDGVVMPFIPLAKIEGLEKDGTISGGMIPKINACRIALEKGVGRCHIVSGLKDGALLKEFFTREGSGTMILKDPNAYENVRPAQKKDIPVIFRLLEEGYRDGFLRERTREEILEQVDDFSVFEIDEQVIGCACLTAYGESAELGGLITLTKFQGKGIASILLEEVLKKARQKGYKRVFAVTKKIGGFFERAGFSERDASFLPKERLFPFDSEKKVYCIDFS